MRTQHVFTHRRKKKEREKTRNSRAYSWQQCIRQLIGRLTLQRRHFHSSSSCCVPLHCTDYCTCTHYYYIASCWVYSYSVDVAVFVYLLAPIIVVFFLFFFLRSFCLSFVLIEIDAECDVCTTPHAARNVLSFDSISMKIINKWIIIHYYWRVWHFVIGAAQRATQFTVENKIK